MPRKRADGEPAVETVPNRPRGKPPLWIGEETPDGQPVDPEVAEAAHRIWARVLYFVRSERGDEAGAAEVLEEAVYAVCRRNQRAGDDDPIKNIDSYLYHAFIKRFNRQAVREARLQYVELEETLGAISREPARDWVAELEQEIILKRVIAAMKPRVRAMFALRCAGHSWEEVGRQLGMSKHNAEVQFAYGVRKAREELGLEEKAPRPRRRKT